MTHYAIYGNDWTRNVDSVEEVEEILEVSPHDKISIYEIESRKVTIEELREAAPIPEIFSLRRSLDGYWTEIVVLGRFPKVNAKGWEDIMFKKLALKYNVPKDQIFVDVTVCLTTFRRLIFNWRVSGGP